jgi:uncharacterized small protein (TIGR04563 family)
MPRLGVQVSPGVPTCYSAAMTDASKRKQSLYFEAEDIQEIEAEALRLERSRSWVVQRAWLLARGRIRALSSDPERDPGVAPREAPLGTPPEEVHGNRQVPDLGVPGKEHSGHNG